MKEVGQWESWKATRSVKLWSGLREDVAEKLTSDELLFLLWWNKQGSLEWRAGSPSELKAFWGILPSSIYSYFIKNTERVVNTRFSLAQFQDVGGEIMQLSYMNLLERSRSQVLCVASMSMLFCCFWYSAFIYSSFRDCILPWGGTKHIKETKTSLKKTG